MSFGRIDDRSAVFVIDDDDTLREALRSLFASVGLQVYLFETAQQFLTRRPPDVPCCLVLDVRLPGISGLDFQIELSKAGVRIPIVFITGHGDIAMTVKAMRAGAVEFLTKPFRDQDLLDAVRLAIERHRSQRENDDVVARTKGNFASLTPREQEVIRLVSSGLMNKQIAARLGVSEITVKVHRGNVMRKMGAKSLVDLVHMVDTLGLAEPRPRDSFSGER
jgi:FixJ family two-component response regulator